MRTRFAFALALCVGGVSSSLAQAPVTWVHFYGQPSGSTAEGANGAVSMRKTADGGYVMLAPDLNPQPPATGRNDCCAVVVTKVDSNESVLWESSYTTVNSGNPGLYPHAILQDGANYLVSTDIVNSPWLLKLDGTGGVTWSRSGYTSSSQGFFSSGQSLAVASDGNYVMGGTWNGVAFALAEISSSDGSPVWEKYYPGGSTSTQANALIRTSDDGYALAGSFVEGSDVAYRVLKTDSGGTPVFDHAYHVAGQSWYATAIAQLPDGGFAVAGTSGGAGSLGVLVLRLDATGAIVWQDTYVSMGGNGASAVTLASDGDLLVAGSEAPTAALMKIAVADGSLIRTKSFGSAGFFGNFSAVTAESDGSTTLAGNGGNFGASVDGSVLLRVGPAGEFTGCMYIERTSTVDFTVSAGSAVAETVASGTQTVSSPTSAAREISAEAIVSQVAVCSNVLPEGLSPLRLKTDAHPTASNNSNVNGVLDLGESVMIEPIWIRTSVPGAIFSDIPSVENFDGSSPGVGSPLFDFAAFKFEDWHYFAPPPPPPPPPPPEDCYDGNDTDCYDAHTQPGFAPLTRPALHIDVHFDETLNATWAFRWTIHIGDSFEDVAVADPFYPSIETVLHNGITAGCGGFDYCPGSDTTRAQMAVFILKGEHGGTYAPPACSTTVFADVPCPGAPFVDWINQLASEGITGGCGGGNYCPSATITRAQMAVFLLKAEHGTGYVPPACTGVFPDVPCPSQFADWIEQLAIEQITAGCGGGDYCPGNPVTRGQMAVFLTKTFQLDINAVLP